MREKWKKPFFLRHSGLGHFLKKFKVGQVFLPHLDVLVINRLVDQVDLADFEPRNVVDIIGQGDPAIFRLTIFSLDKWLVTWLNFLS